MLPDYDTALTKALNWIKASYNPVGIIVSGSIIRGNADANSDFDIYVIHKENYRQRVQKYFEGVPFEIFINNIEHVNQYYEADRKNNRPVTAHLISTGKIYLGETDAEILDLVEKAKEYNHTPAQTTGEQLIQLKYSIALLFEDATDVIQEEPEAAHYILDKTISEIINFAFITNKTLLPRLKERMYLLSAVNPILGAQVTKYYQCNGVVEKHKLAAQMLLTLQIPDKFFEWTSSQTD